MSNVRQHQMKHPSIVRVLLGIATGGALVSCQTLPSPSEREAQVRGALQSWVSAFNGCNSEKAAALYARDAALWGTVAESLTLSPQGIRQSVDSEKASTLYGPDAHLRGIVSQSLITTPEGIRQYFERVCAMSTPPKVEVDKQTVRVDGESAVSAGTYTFTVPVQGQQRSLSAGFNFAYRRVGQSWFITSHHSSFIPGATASAAGR